MEYSWMPPEFKWVPGTEMDLNTIENMKRYFYKPPEAPPEAWFMDPTRQNYYTGLLDEPIDNLEDSHLIRFLFDTGGGIKSFGRYKIWVDWFLYLLPYLLLRIRNGKHIFIPSVTNYLLNLYSYEFFEEYGGVRKDILETLYQSIMAPALWRNQDMQGKEEWYDDPVLYTGSYYALFFFCLKYLSPREIAIWVDSMAVIEGTNWHEEIAVWMKRATKFLNYLTEAEAPKKSFGSGEIDIYDLLENAELDWGDSHIYGMSRKPAYSQTWPLENIEAFWATVRQHPEFKYQPPAE